MEGSRTYMKDGRATVDCHKSACQYFHMPCATNYFFLYVMKELQFEKKKQVMLGIIICKIICVIYF